MVSWLSVVQGFALLWCLFTETKNKTQDPVVLKKIRMPTLPHVTLTTKSPITDPALHPSVWWTCSWIWQLHGTLDEPNHTRASSSSPIETNRHLKVLSITDIHFCVSLCMNQKHLKGSGSGWGADSDSNMLVSPEFKYRWNSRKAGYNGAHL